MPKPSVSRTLKLLDGGKLNVSDSDYRTAMGRRIEGSGVKPDLLLETRIADLLAGRMVVVGYTPRGADRHVFSMRKANAREQARIAPLLEV